MKNIRFPLNINVLYVQQNNPNPLVNISYVHIVLWQIVQTCYNQCPSLCDPSRAHLTITYPNECLVLCLVHNLFLFDVLVWAELSCCNSLMNRKVVCLSSACHMNMHMSISREQPPLMPIDATAVASASSIELIMVLVYSLARVRRCIMTTRLSAVLPRPTWDAFIRDEGIHMDYMLELKSIILLGQKIIFNSWSTNYMLAETAYYIFACLMSQIQIHE